LKRDMDIIRKIILALQSADRPITSVPGISEIEFLIHGELIIEAGLAKGAVSPSGSKAGIPAKVILFRLTWEGQDFADSITEDTLWEKVKENILKPSASWSFSILLEYIKSELRRRIPGLEKLP